MGRSCHNRRRGRRGLERTTATPIVHIVAIVIGHLVLPAAHLTRVHRTVQLAPPARQRRSSGHFGCCRRCRRCRQWPSVGARTHVQRQMESGAHQHYGGRAGLRFFFGWTGGPVFNLKMPAHSTHTQTQRGLAIPLFGCRKSNHKECPLAPTGSTNCARNDATQPTGHKHRTSRRWRQAGYAHSSGGLCVCVCDAGWMGTDCNISVSFVC